MRDAADELEGLLDDAVRRRMVADVPLGAFLSGGLDSSLVVSSMSRQAQEPIKTTSIGFDDAAFSELGTAREIAAYLDTDHRDFVVEPQAADVLDQIAWHLDEPFADSSALATWYVCKMTRESVTVALSGDGGDEGFGGYTFRYIPHMAESAIRSVLPASLRCILFGPLGRAWPASSRLPRALRLKTILENLSLGDAEAYYRDLIWLREDTRGQIYKPEFLHELRGFTPFEVVHPFYTENNALDAVSRSQYSDISVYMTDDVLVKVDRMSMAHSLEVRAPLLDYQILEFAAGLPRHLKLDMRRGKIILRELARRRLPREIRSMPKRGFSIPAADWLRGELREMVEQIVLRDEGLIAEVLDHAAIHSLWAQHLNRSRDHSVFFWGLLMLGLWEKSAKAFVSKAAA
jgi:asparagine synthase (glutamine-hydrolysing)